MAESRYTLVIQEDDYIFPTFLGQETPINANAEIPIRIDTTAKGTFVVRRFYPGGPSRASREQANDKEPLIFRRV